MHDVLRLGVSRLGIPIEVVHVGDPTGQPVLVVGCIHGSEGAGIAAIDDLLARALPDHVNLWVIRDMNPDGLRAGTRDDAAGVDLNRNFPYHWISSAASPTTSPGPRALSEPESRAVAALIRRIRPALGIWFHQSLAVVDVSEGPRLQERLMSRLLGLPERVLTDYPGSAVGFENSLRPGTSFVVELRGGPLGRASARAVAAAVVSAARSLRR